MPKPEFGASFGVKEAFSGAADFSGMTGSRGLFISEVVHEACVAVEAAGTRAADRQADLVVGQGKPGILGPGRDGADSPGHCRDLALVGVDLTEGGGGSVVGPGRSSSSPISASTISSSRTWAWDTSGAGVSATWDSRVCCELVVMISFFCGSAPRAGRASLAPSGPDPPWGRSASGSPGMAGR